MANYNIIVNKVSGQQVVYVIEESGSYTLGSDTLVWDELVDGEAINDVGTPWTDAEIQANIGKFTRQTSPSLHLLSGSYITGHLAAIEAAYDKIIRTWQLKFELHDRSLLTTIDSAVTATYAASPMNKVRWENKKNVKARGNIWDIIKTEMSYTDAQMISLWDAAELWDEVE